MPASDTRYDFDDRVLRELYAAQVRLRSEPGPRRGRWTVLAGRRRARSPQPLRRPA